MQRRTCACAYASPVMSDPTLARALRPSSPTPVYCASADS
jgi:hypothetical protein